MYSIKEEDKLLKQIFGYNYLENEMSIIKSFLDFFLIKKINPLFFAGFNTTIHFNDNKQIIINQDSKNYILETNNDFEKIKEYIYFLLEKDEEQLVIYYKNTDTALPIIASFLDFVKEQNEIFYYQLKKESDSSEDLAKEMVLYINALNTNIINNAFKNIHTKNTQNNTL